ncbi:cyclin-like protein [Russula earlei]|uniref:Cyclin-like protein n=1 Tax=Russula earlei TaxID=71964 RepID=A0ACC0UBV1_9AGAM|nr:cyclin-like protein [Russula earlei]
MLRWRLTSRQAHTMDRATLKQARSEDLQYVESAEHIDFLNIYFANRMRPTFSVLAAYAMTPTSHRDVGQTLAAASACDRHRHGLFQAVLRQKLYCETDPFMVIAACCYVAAKAEESPVHIKNVVSESRQMFSQEAAHADVSEAGEVGVGIDNGPRYWGSGEGRLELGEGPLQTAWHVVIPYSFIVNDTYRSELCLLCPPHMIAIAAIHLTLVLNDKTRDAIQAQSAAPAPPPRRSSRTNTGSAHRKPAPEILSLYTLWERYSDAAPESGLAASAGDDVVTPAFLARLADLAHPASGQPMATNKRLGMTQAVG